MFRVEQKIKTDIETSFVQTKAGTVGVYSLALFRAADDSLQLYATLRLQSCSLSTCLLVIDKEAGDEFLEKIAEAVKTEKLQAVLDSYEPLYCKKCLGRMGFDSHARPLCGSCGSRKVIEE